MKKVIEFNPKEIFDRYPEVTTLEIVVTDNLERKIKILETIERPEEEFMSRASILATFGGNDTSGLLPYISDRDDYVIDRANRLLRAYTRKLRIEGKLR